jgi:hypothetical protein
MQSPVSVEYSAEHSRPTILALRLLAYEAVSSMTAHAPSPRKGAPEDIRPAMYKSVMILSDISSTDKLNSAFA